MTRCSQPRFRPIALEWFVNNGIEVWSAEEGQQRFDNHVDKLMNYIRYWQASGESLKTSIRTKTRLGQIVQEGRFRGGTPAYGFQLVKKGRTGKKNRELYDIEINPDEAFAVKRMFDLTDRYGYGGRKISTILKSEGIVNLRTGEPFHYSTIQHILANIMNAGILRSGETQSEVFPELQIIPLEQFQRVAKAREQRSVNYAIKCGWEPETITLADGSEATVVRSTGTYPRKIVGKALLSGNVYCGHCGGRIFATTARKAHHPSEHPERIAIYKCYNRTQHKEQCDGPTTYRAEKVDGVVESILRGIFERAKRVDEQEFLKAQVQISSKQYQQKLKLAKAEYSKATKELSKWEELMLASIEGTCVFSLLLQVLLHPLTFCCQFQFRQLFLIVPGNHILGWEQCELQGPVARHTRFGRYLGGFHHDESSLLQLFYIPAHGVGAHTHRLPNGLVAGPALMSLLVFAPAQIAVHRQLTGTQAQEKDLIGQREKVSHVLHPAPPVCSSTH